MKYGSKNICLTRSHRNSSCGYFIACLERPNESNNMSKMMTKFSKSANLNHENIILTNLNLKTLPN